MTGPEHYRKAEGLLDNAWCHVGDNLAAGFLHSPETRAALIAQAQVHATLALAAVTVDQIASRGPGDFAQEWPEAVWPR